MGSTQRFFLPLGLMLFSLWLTVCSALPAQTTSSRLPVPPSTAVAEAKQLIAGTYKREVETSKTPAQKRKLAQVLIEEGGNNRDDSVSQYALYDVARLLAIGIGDAQTASAAVEKLGRRFDIDVLAAQMDVATQIATTAKTDEDEYFLESHLGTLVTALTKEAKWKEAIEFCKLGNATAKKMNDADLAKVWTDRLAEISAREKATGELAAAMQALEQSPADEAANAAAGKLLCFALADWQKGLPMLALCDEEQSQSAAEKELRATSASDRLGVADAWYDIAAKEKDPITRRHLQRHALDLYRAAEPGLTSLAQKRAQNRGVELFAAAMPDRIPLSVLKPTEYIVFGADQGPFMKAKIGGRIFAESVWAHAPNSSGASQVVFDLPCEFKYIKGVCALHDDIHPRTAVQFRVNVDGKGVWSAKERISTGKVVPFRIDLKGHKQINLIVDCPGEHHESWAIWVAPVLQK